MMVLMVLLIHDILMNTGTQCHQYGFPFDRPDDADSAEAGVVKPEVWGAKDGEVMD